MHKGRIKNIGKFKGMDVIVVTKDTFTYDDFKKAIKEANENER